MRSARSIGSKVVAVVCRAFAPRLAGITLVAAIAAGCGSSPSSPSSPLGTPPDSGGTGASDVASDDFERAALGPNWVELFGQSGGIVGGKDFGMLAAGFLTVDWAARFGADQFSEAVIAATKPANVLVQVHVRRQSDSFARYGFHYNPEKTPAVWEIKYDGVPTPDTRILASSTGPALVPGDVIRIEVRGREISGFLNGQRLLVATDLAPNAILGTGGTGITTRLKDGTTTTSPAAVVASWRGGTLK